MFIKGCLSWLVVGRWLAGGMLRVCWRNSDRRDVIDSVSSNRYLQSSVWGGEDGFVCKKCIIFAAAPEMVRS